MHKRHHGDCIEYGRRANFRSDECQNRFFNQEIRFVEWMNKRCFPIFRRQWVGELTLYNPNDVDLNVTIPVFDT